MYVYNNIFIIIINLFIYCHGTPLTYYSPKFSSIFSKKKIQTGGTGGAISLSFGGNIMTFPNHIVIFDQNTVRESFVRLYL